MTRRDFIAISLLLAGIAFVAVQRFDAPSERRPDPRTYEDPGRTPGGFAPRRPAPPPGAAGLPPPSLADPGFTIEAEVKTGDVTGTAFSIGPGRWMSAKHVTESCRQVWIQTGPRRGVRAERVVEHPGADLSIIFTDGGAPELPVSTGVLNLGQVGFYFGFPKGEAGAVSTDLIGRARMRTEGSRHSVEPVVGWAERGGAGAEGHGNSVPRFHVTWGTGPEVVRVAQRHGLQSINWHRQSDFLSNQSAFNERVKKEHE